jgi:ribosomal protein L13E
MSYSIAKVDGQWVKFAPQKLTISIDFDKTWSAAPALWLSFTRTAKRLGHRVVMITRRSDTPHNRAEVEKKTAGAGFSALIFAAGGQKEAAARAKGIRVDVWIDDYPEGIPS